MPPPEKSRRQVLDLASVSQTSDQRRSPCLYYQDFCPTYRDTRPRLLLLTTPNLGTVAGGSNAKTGPTAEWSAPRGTRHRTQKTAPPR